MAQRPTKQLNVSELDFDQIKNNLKEFLRSQDALQDYDFEGSALSTLVDLMAYVTHYNAVNANIGINETFLETAQSRGSVVGHARQLSYTPKSATGATANINVAVNNPNSQTLTLNKGHRFRSVIDNTTYIFVTTKSYQTTNAFFGDVEIKQGEQKTTEYIFDATTSERFVIPDINVDTTTLEVKVYDSVNSENSENYTQFIPVKNINNVTSNSFVYYLSESFDGKYEIKFGDGVLGASLVNGNLIEISYIVTDGPDANNAARFSMTDTIENNSDVSITTNQVAIGGSSKESIKSIKYNAPLTFASQNRAVTPDDYRAIILENFSNAKSISVWGGEDNDPPQYGKTFISIIPNVGDILSGAEKTFLTDSVLRPKAVVSITPEFIDPNYTYVAMEVFYKRNSSETSLSFGEINSLVKNAIDDYNENQIRKFDGVLRYSALLNAIDTAEKSIVNSYVRLYMKKRFVPNTSGKIQTYELVFSNPIYDTTSTDPVIYRSSSFTYNGEQCTLQDYIASNGERRVKVVRLSGVNQITVAADVGYVDARAGKIILTSFIPTAFIGSYIELTVVPNSNDVSPKRNNVVSIDMNDVSIIGAEDPISTGSAAGGLAYDLIPRHG